jgi:endonuclease/exonuclease/phosphatase family metal-dependent hydrolase
MYPPRSVINLVLSAALLTIAVTGCDEIDQPLAPELTAPTLAVEAPPQAAYKDGITVMTRNLYHGGDIGPVLQVGFSDLKLLSETAAFVWAEVQANDFHERVVTLVDEIEAADPDVIGLQELARFVTLDMNPSTLQPQPTGVIDFQSIMEAELASRGLDYSFVAVQDNTQVQVPVAGVEVGGQFIPTRLVQLTVRDGVLLRGGMVQGAVVTNANYEDFVSLGNDPFGNPIQLLRGWTRVDLDVGGTPYHFVNTHLEIQRFSDVQEDQTEELLTEVVEDLDGIIILTGDFNSDADGDPGSPAWTPSYGEIRSAGFQDAWAMAHPGKSVSGLTCCQASNLRNTNSELGSRVDFVFIRTPGPSGVHGHIPGSVTVDRVGADPLPWMAPGSVWTSDHVGLVANIRVAPGIAKLRF